MTEFLTILHESSAKLNVQRSQFYSHVFEVESVSQAKEKIKTLSKSYNDATHVCWALRIIEKELVEMSSDGGEPSGTAGFPILTVLRENNLVNLCCIVVRYFGGVKLGVRGLIDAYSQATRLVLENTSMVKLTKVFEHTFTCKYEQIGQVLGIIKKYNGKIQKIEQNELVIIKAFLSNRVNEFNPQVAEKLVKLI